jgi:hypothetical protein
MFPFRGWRLGLWTGTAVLVAWRLDAMFPQSRRWETDKRQIYFSILIKGMDFFAHQTANRESTICSRVRSADNVERRSVPGGWVRLLTERLEPTYSEAHYGVKINYFYLNLTTRFWYLPMKLRYPITWRSGIEHNRTLSSEVFIHFQPPLSVGWTNI